MTKSPPRATWSPADLPDWLKGQVPADSQKPEPPAFESPAIDTPDWLKGLEDARTGEPPEALETPQEKFGAEELPDWLSGLGAAGAVPRLNGKRNPRFPTKRRTG
ncbi:MAG: hypothetical protein HND47_18805 [Chloroflexi bacterium]|nr:hypothetical protein [Chloroflexota bacterium]